MQGFVGTGKNEGGVDGEEDEDGGRQNRRSRLSRTFLAGSGAPEQGEVDSRL